MIKALVNEGLCIYNLFHFSDDENFLIRKFHPGVIIDQPICFAFFIKIVSGVEFKSEFSLQENHFVKHFFPGISHQGGEDDVVAME